MLKLSHGRKMEKPDTPDSEKKAASSPDANGANGGGSSDPIVIRMPVDVRSVALSIIAALAGIIALQYAQTVLIPVVLGVLLSYALSPMVTSLARHHVPRALGAALAVSLLVGSIGVGVYTLSDEAGAIIAKVPEAAQRIRQRVAAQRSQRGTAILQQVQDAAKEIEKTADAATKPVEDTRASRTGRDQLQQVEVVEPAFRASDYIWIGGVGLFGFLGQFAVILFLVYFLLVTGDLYKRKLVKIAGTDARQKARDGADPRRDQPADRELHQSSVHHQPDRRRRDRPHLVGLRPRELRDVGPARRPLQLDSLPRTGPGQRADLASSRSCSSTTWRGACM